MPTKYMSQLVETTNYTSFTRGNDDGLWIKYLYDNTCSLRWSKSTLTSCLPVVKRFDFAPRFTQLGNGNMDYFLVWPLIMTGVCNCGLSIMYHMHRNQRLLL
jgi:hypothetical protein